jgi:hypothetical protein
MMAMYKKFEKDRWGGEEGGEEGGHLSLLICTAAWASNDGNGTVSDT